MRKYIIKRFSKVEGEYSEYSSESHSTTDSNGRVKYISKKGGKSGEYFTDKFGNLIQIENPEKKVVRKGSYKIKRYSEGEEKESHTLRNTLLGVGAVAGTLAAGKRGWLGAGVQKGIGTATGRLGNAIGSKSLVQSGASTTAKAQITKMNNAFANKNPNATKEALDAFKEKTKGMQETLTQNYANKFTNQGVWGKDFQAQVAQRKQAVANASNPVSSTIGQAISYT